MLSNTKRLVASVVYARRTLPPSTCVVVVGDVVDVVVTVVLLGLVIVLVDVGVVVVFANAVVFDSRVPCFFLVEITATGTVILTMISTITMIHTPTLSFFRQISRSLQ